MSDSPWQFWNTRPEPGPDSEPILAYSQSWDCVWKVEAKLHLGMWHWLVNHGGYHVLANSTRYSHWMPLPPLPERSDAGGAR